MYFPFPDHADMDHTILVIFKDMETINNCIELILLYANEMLSYANDFITWKCLFFPLHNMEMTLLNVNHFVIWK